MSPLNKNVQAFFALVRAGLWEKDVQLASYGQIDFNEVYRLAEEQSVVGLVAAGIEHIVDAKIPQEVALTFASSTLQLEQKNLAMNGFVGKLIVQLRSQDIYALLVKGQGIAQCYERPLWRTCGDVDLLLSDDCLKMAMLFFDSISHCPNHITKKNIKRAHYEYELGEWIVELHGSMHSDLSKRVDKVVDNVQNDIFYGGNVRSWNNNGTAVFLPSFDNDVILIFTHILQHLFLEGIGVRQICDWCRLLWTYKDSINHELLESRLRMMGLISEWKVFANLVVDYLGMPIDALPLYEENPPMKRKAKRIISFILYVGNFGHNRKVDWSNSLRRHSKLIIHKIIDTVRLTTVFPVDAPKFLAYYTWDSVRNLMA